MLCKLLFYCIVQRIMTKSALIQYKCNFLPNIFYLQLFECEHAEPMNTKSCLDFFILVYNFLLFYFYLIIFIFFDRQRDGNRKRERNLSCTGSLSKCLQHLGLGQAKARSKFNSGLPYGWQDPNT